MTAFHKVLLTALVVIATVNLSSAQSNRFSTQEIVREKIRVSPEVLEKVINGQIPEWIKEENEYTERKSHDRTTNNLVSGSADPESEVHAAINPVDSSNIVVSANSSGASVLTEGLNPIYYTKDFGTTWLHSDFLAKPDGGSLVVGGGDPMFAYDKTGKVYMSWINLHASLNGVYWDLFWAKSSDGGETWVKGTEPIAHSEASLATFIPDTIYDKQWMVVDQSNSAFQNTLYCVFFEASSDNSFGQISVRRKTSAMANFTPISVRASDLGFTNLQFSSIDVDGNGGVHVSYFATLDDVNWSLYHSLSTDGGVTFAASTKISDVYLQGFSYTPVPSDSVVGVQVTRMYPCPHLRVDKSGGVNDGRCYAVWSAEGTIANDGTGLDVFISYSSDNGQTWSNAQHVNNDNTNNHNFYPALAVSSQGVVAIAWYDRRSDPNNLNTHYYLGYSFDGGNTFTTQIPISDQGTDFSTVGSQSGGFGVGEYNQVVTTATKAIPVWSDARNNDGQLDVYAAIFNIEPNITSVNQVMSVMNTWHVNAPQPNPANDFINIEASSDRNVSLTVLVTDVTGKQMMKQSWSVNGNNQLQLPIKTFADGVYTLQVSDGNASTSYKFVKQ